MRLSPRRMASIPAWKGGLSRVPIHLLGCQTIHRRLPGQETVYKLRLCLVALASWVVLYLWGACCASVCICRGEGRQWGGRGAPGENGVSQKEHHVLRFWSCWVTRT